MTLRPMEPWTTRVHGRLYGNAAAAAALCPDPKTGEPILPSTFSWYARVKKPAGNPPPQYHHIDDTTRHQMFDLDEVAAWHAKRKGRGNWGGIGAQARKKPKARKKTGVDTAPPAGE